MSKRIDERLTESNTKFVGFLRAMPEIDNWYESFQRRNRKIKKKNSIQGGEKTSRHDHSKSHSHAYTIGGRKVSPRMVSPEN